MHVVSHPLLSSGIFIVCVSTRGSSTSRGALELPCDTHRGLSSTRYGRLLGHLTYCQTPWSSATHELHVLTWACEGHCALHVIAEGICGSSQVLGLSLQEFVGNSRQVRGVAFNKTSHANARARHCRACATSARRSVHGQRLSTHGGASHSCGQEAGGAFAAGRRDCPKSLVRRKAGRRGGHRSRTRASGPCTVCCESCGLEAQLIRSRVDAISKVEHLARSAVCGFS